MSIQINLNVNSSLFAQANAISKLFGGGAASKAEIQKPAEASGIPFAQRSVEGDTLQLSQTVDSSRSLKIYTKPVTPKSSLNEQIAISQMEQTVNTRIKQVQQEDNPANHDIQQLVKDKIDKEISRQQSGYWQFKNSVDKIVQFAKIMSKGPTINFYS
jgi:hypothetical protein